MSYPITRTGGGLSDDQKALLTTMERQRQPLDDWQRGSLDALRTVASQEEAARIDRVSTGASPGQAPARASRAGYEQHLAASRTAGVCPTCGRSG